MIVLDGRTDREKLSELLEAGEQTHLDYKSQLDLQDPAGRLNFVKDVVAMSNRSHGGYILVGVDDEGVPCLPVGTLDRQRFDGARLGQLVRNYIEGQIEIHPQIHDLDGEHEVALIRVEGHRDGLPVPMAKVGQFESKAGKSITVFREGEVVVREGSANVPLRHSHWADLLATRDRQIREQAQSDIQELVTALAGHLRTQGGPAGTPLRPEMDESAFTAAVVANLEAESDVRIRQFLNQMRNTAGASISGQPRIEDTLDQISIVGAQALFFDRKDVARDAVDTLHAIYVPLVAHGERVASELVEILVRVYALGSLAWRGRRWAFVRDIVQRPVELSPGGYTHPSWLRHGQVMGSRRKLFPSNRGGLIVSAARKWVIEHQGVRPDILDGSVPAADELADEDALLNSLCQFDLAYCLLVAAEGKGRSSGYPSCSAFHQTRSEPAYELIVDDAGARRELFPDSGDEAIARAIVDVHHSAASESWDYGGWWSGLPPRAAEFVGDHLPKDTDPS